MLDSLRDQARRVSDTVDNADNAARHAGRAADHMNAAAGDVRMFVTDARVALFIVTAAAVASAIIVATCALRVVDKLAPIDG